MCPGCRTRICLLRYALHNSVGDKAPQSVSQYRRMALTFQGARTSSWLSPCYLLVMHVERGRNGNALFPSVSGTLKARDHRSLPVPRYASSKSSLTLRPNRNRVGVRSEGRCRAFSFFVDGLRSHCNTSRSVRLACHSNGPWFLPAWVLHVGGRT